MVAQVVQVIDGDLLALSAQFFLPEGHEKMEQNNNFSLDLL